MDRRAVGVLGEGRLRPVQPSGGHLYRRLSGGIWHTCGIREGGTVESWGYSGDAPPPTKRWIEAKPEGRPVKRTPQVTAKEWSPTDDLVGGGGYDPSLPKASGPAISPERVGVGRGCRQPAPPEEDRKTSRRPWPPPKQLRQGWEGDSQCRRSPRSGLRRGRGSACLREEPRVSSLVMSLGASPYICPTPATLTPGSRKVAALAVAQAAEDARRPRPSTLRGRASRSGPLTHTTPLPEGHGESHRRPLP